MKKLLGIGFALLISSLSLVACAPPAATTAPPTTAPAAAGSSGGSASEVADLAARNERLTAAYTETVELLRRSAQGENVDAAVARLPDPADLAPPTRVDSRSRRHRSRPARTAAAPAAAPSPTETEAPAAPTAAAPVAPPMGSFGNPFGSGPATTAFRDPIRNVIGNVAFNNGPTPWEQDGAAVGRSQVNVMLVNMTTAAQIIVNGRQVCVSTGGEFLRMMTTNGRQICVVPPNPGRTQNVRFLASDEGSPQEILVQRYSYNSYQPIGRFRGSCSRTMVPGDDLTGVWAVNDDICH